MKTAIAIDLGGTFIKYGIVNIEGEILLESKVATPHHSRDEVLNTIVKSIEELKTKFNPVCVGLGTPGLIDVEKGRIIGGAPQIHDWVDLGLGDYIFEKTGLPAFVDNDANMMGLGEYKFGNNRALKNLVFLTIGTGIGSAIIINGSLYRGGFFAGGEVGYIPFNRRGVQGFWEDFGSTGAMVNYYSDIAGLSNEDVNGKIILDLLKTGDKNATTAFEEHIDVLGQGIAGLISVLNPEKIIIGGGISEAGADYISAINSGVLKYAVEECYADLKIEGATLGNKAGFLGAGYLALSSIQ